MMNTAKNHQLTLAAALITACLGLSFTSLQAKASGYTAEIFEQGSEQTKKIGSLTVEINPGSDTKESSKATYKDEAGEVLVEEQALMTGTKLHRLEVQQKQTGAHGLIEVKDDKVHFSTENKGDKKDNKESLEEPLVVGASIQGFVREKWTDIIAGKTIKFRYGVWARAETVGFEIFKTAEEKFKDQDAVILKMKPSSFIISAMVKPIIFRIKKDGSQFLMTSGRVAIMKKDGDKFKDLDADIVYKYE